MIVQEYQSLKAFNTFGLDVRCKWYVSVTDVGVLRDVYVSNRLADGPVLLLGGGSNLLFTRDFDGIVLHMQIKGRKVLDETEDDVLLSCGGGEDWHELVRWCISRGFYGMENLSLIPGNAGTAPVQNIGAYGVEVAQLIDHVVYFDLDTGDEHVLDNAGCGFGYRDSIFKHELRQKAIVTSVAFRLQKNRAVSTEYGSIRDELKKMGISDPGPDDVSEAVIRIRQSKLPDPATIGNAGSFFKNPLISSAEATRLKDRCPDIPCYPADNGMVKVAAGWLIDKGGWKGYRGINCGVYEKQALVLVNFGGAKGGDILNLSRDIQRDVARRYGIHLEPEVMII